MVLPIRPVSRSRLSLIYAPYARSRDFDCIQHTYLTQVPATADNRDGANCLIQKQSCKTACHLQVFQTQLDFCFLVSGSKLFYGFKRVSLYILHPLATKAFNNCMKCKRNCIKLVQSKQTVPHSPTISVS